MKYCAEGAEDHSVIHLLNNHRALEKMVHQFPFYLPLSFVESCFCFQSTDRFLQKQHNSNSTVILKYLRAYLGKNKIVIRVPPAEITLPTTSSFTINSTDRGEFSSFFLFCDNVVIFK